MDSAPNREAIKKYFAPFPKWALWLTLGGALIAVLGVGTAPEPLIAGLIALAVGGFVIWRSLGNRPSDAEMDRYIEADLSRAKEKALNKTSIDESELVGESVVVTGPRFWDTAGAPNLHKRGKDNKIRFTPINISVLHMTANQIISYQACLDLTTGNFLNEGTDEYFYRDVVSVSTKTQSMSFNSEKLGTIQLNSAETFVLTTSGGTSVETVLKDPKLIELMGGGEIPTTEAERAIQVVRRMLREKKGATA